MSRPYRDGVDYFPLDTDFFSDKKVQLLRAEFGMQGVSIALAIMAEVYRTNGYYKKWDDDDCLLMSQGVAGGCSPELISEVVRGCLRRSLFDRRVFKAFGVITSVGIQRRFVRIAAKHRDEIPIFREYWLLDVDDKKDVPASARNKITFKSVIGSENPDKSSENPNKSSENPIKESKLNQKDKESTDIASSTRPPALCQQVIDMFNSVCISLPKVKTLSSARKKAISARLREIDNDMDELRRIFERVEASDFLCGRKKEWTASFDWIMKPSNFLKIREGNYDQHTQPYHIDGRISPTFDIAEIERQLDAELMRDMGKYDKMAGTEDDE